ncbi:hypothetical protein [Ruminococcus sp.]|uniref:hypothetical protein n=1 Tax=Ruminococcus sp. TaxID=41978 RepID=UPI001B4C49BB|nr:hypothetical protein [Ruminococcus sp.]MBP5433766.1 hypothetical protein [Ruminococcus sp.]
MKTIRDVWEDYTELCIGIAASAVFILSICFLAIPVEREMYVSRTRWIWDIPVYQYTVHEESRWSSAPEGAYDVRKEWEVEHHRTVKTGEWVDSEGIRHDITFQEPVYEWHYYYKINKWDKVRDITSVGINHTPHEAECSLQFSVSNPEIGDLKRGAHTERYEVYGVSGEDEARYNISKADWKQIEVGGKIKFKRFRYGDRIWDIRFI